MITKHTQLDVWNVAMELVISCYKETRQFPKHELYGLSSQVQRAAVSIPANIAEGFGRYHRAEFLHHLAYAYGSVMELETHVEIARRLEYINEENARLLQNTTDRLGRMLNRLQASIRNQSTVSESAGEYFSEDALRDGIRGTRTETRGTIS